MTVTRGITSRLDQYFSDLLDPENGTIKVANDAFESRVESLEASIGRVNQISEAKSQYLIEQVTQLERVLAELQTTSGFLSRGPHTPSTNLPPGRSTRRSSLRAAGLSGKNWKP